MHSPLHRTNNISNLEEQNTKLFLEIAKELGIKSAFGDLDNKVFEKYDYFSKVLEGISKLSKKVEKKIKVSSFSCRGKKDDYEVEDHEELNKIYDDEQEENEVQNDDYVEYVDASEELCDLDEAVEELIKVNRNYKKYILKNIKVNFVDANDNSFLQTNFFPSFKIDKLLALHEDLGKLFN